VRWRPTRSPQVLIEIWTEKRAINPAVLRGIPKITAAAVSADWASRRRFHAEMRRHRVGRHKSLDRGLTPDGTDQRQMKQKAAKEAKGNGGGRFE
jgi:hypothetical protein